MTGKNSTPAACVFARIGDVAKVSGDPEGNSATAVSPGILFPVGGTVPVEFAALDGESSRRQPEASPKAVLTLNPQPALFPSRIKGVPLLVTANVCGCKGK